MWILLQNSNIQIVIKYTFSVGYKILKFDKKSYSQFEYVQIMCIMSWKKYQSSSYYVAHYTHFLEFKMKI